MHATGKANPRGGFRQDYYSGALLILLGVLVVVKGASYRLGCLSRMGPGYFPVSIGCFLAFIGLLIAVGACFARGSDDPGGESVRARPNWRGCLCIAASLSSFVLLARYGGLAAATFSLVFVAALGDRNNSLACSALLAGTMVVVAALVFRLALGIQIPLFCWA